MEIIMKFHYFLALLLLINCPFTAQSTPNNVAPYGIIALLSGIALGGTAVALDKHLNTPHQTTEGNEPSFGEKGATILATISGILSVIAGFKKLDTSSKLYKALAAITKSLLKKRFFGRNSLKLQQAALSSEASKTFYAGLILTLWGSFCATYGTTKLIQETLPVSK